jgi:vitamin B12 transporter
MSSRLLLAAIAAIACTHVVAQVANPLPAVAVTATRGAQPIADLLADLTVIEHDEIVRSGAQTLVLVDGLRVGSSSVGATSLEAIPLDQIERVEILRGPASSLYGADAIGGVIQVFTKRAKGDAFAGNLAAGYGTYDTRNASASVRGAMGPLAFSLTGGGTRSAGFNSIVNPANFSYNPERDGYASENAGGNAALAWAPGQDLSVQYLRNRLNNAFDAGAPYFDDRTVTTLEAWSVVSRNRLGERWTSIVTVGEGSDDSVSLTAFGQAPFKTTQRQYTWQNDWTLPAGALSLAVERREEQLATDSAFDVTQRNTNSVTGVYQVRYDAFAVQANLRRDDSSQYGGKTTGGLALGYHVSPEWRVTAGFSTGFKPPSFNDLYFPLFSNPDLVPETARNTEVAAYWTSSYGDARWEARAIGYYNRVGELIVFQCDAGFNCRPDNVDDATLEGVTLGLDATYRGTRLTASLDLQRPQDDRTGNLLPRRARQHGALTVLQQAGPVQLGCEFVASSLRYDDAANTVKMGGYGIVNLTLDWPFAKGWSLLVRGNNVLDKNYQLAADYSTGGAQVFASLRWQP